MSLDDVTAKDVILEMQRKIKKFDTVTPKGRQFITKKSLSDIFGIMNVFSDRIEYLEDAIKTLEEDYETRNKVQTES